MNKRILVFDDEEVFVQLMKTIFRKYEIEVYGQTNCNNLIEKIKEVEPALIFMDNKIPAIGGVKATQAIKRDEEISSIPVIYFSGNDKIKELATEAGADDFLPKPFEIKDLQDLVLKYI